MRIEERLGLAHLAYRRAIVVVRSDSTPATWRRLLTAGKNLRGARADQERTTRTVRPGPAVPGSGVLIRLLRPVPPELAARCPALARECERSHALIRRAEALARESRELRGELADLVRSWRRSMAASPNAAAGPRSGGTPHVPIGTGRPMHEGSM